MQANNPQIVVFLITSTLVILLLMGLIITLLYLYQKKRVSFYEHLANTKLEIQEETFQNISREIHDNIGLSLTLAKLQLNTLNFDSIPKAATDVAMSVELIGQAINDLSDISNSMNSEAIGSYGFLNVLQMKLDKIRKLEKFRIHFDLYGSPVFMDSKKELILYRIAQEALNNIIKHAQASVIEFRLYYTGTSLEMTIKDDGIGIDWKKLEKKYPEKIMAGLNNMKKRAKLINGTFNLQSDCNGTTIFITVPFEINEK